MNRTLPTYLGLSWLFFTAACSSPPLEEGTPLFVVAGQSNAEGNVRVSGMLALREALPSHSNALSSEERIAAREGFRVGVGDWCNPDEDYSVAAADVSIDALRSGGLDLSELSTSYALSSASMAAYRWRFQEATEVLDVPYESTETAAPIAHTTGVGPFGVGYGVWDDEDFDVMFYGPELGFGMHLAQQGSRPSFEMLKVAMGGSSLYAHWAPDGPLREQLYTQTAAHLKSRPDTYVAGLIWFQGFNDQFDEVGRQAYAENLTRLISDFRDVYGETVPVVIVQARKVADLAVIAEAQGSVAVALDHVGLAESDGLTECFHYDAASQLVVGQRSAVEMLRLLGSDS